MVIKWGNWSYNPTYRSYITPFFNSIRGPTGCMNWCKLRTPLDFFPTKAALDAQAYLEVWAATKKPQNDGEKSGKWWTPYFREKSRLVKYCNLARLVHWFWWVGCSVFEYLRCFECNDVNMITWLNT